MILRIYNPSCIIYTMSLMLNTLRPPRDKFSSISNATKQIKKIQMVFDSTTCTHHTRTHAITPTISNSVLILSPCRNIHIYVKLWPFCSTHAHCWTGDNALRTEPQPHSHKWHTPRLLIPGERCASICSCHYTTAKSVKFCTLRATDGHSSLGLELCIASLQVIRV